MWNTQIEEIFGLAYEAFRAGQMSVQVEALPFRMSDANLARYAGNPNAPFWAMLKQGSDLFDQTAQPPQVSVCNQRYIFAPSGGAFDPAACLDSAAF